MKTLEPQPPSGRDTLPVGVLKRALAIHPTLFAPHPRFGLRLAGSLCRRLAVGQSRGSVGLCGRPYKAQPGSRRLGRLNCPTDTKRTVAPEVAGGGRVCRAGEIASSRKPSGLCRPGRHSRHKRGRVGGHRGCGRGEPGTVQQAAEQPLSFPGGRRDALSLACG